MKPGKLSHEQLQKLILDRLPEAGNSVASGPAVGLDCAAIRFGDGQVILSSDPITGAAADVGRLAVLVSCNDIASCGIRPSAMMMVIIAPQDATAEDIQLVVDQAASTARRMNVSIVGGHTEISTAVTRFVVCTTAIGFTYGGRTIQASGGRAGDTLLMTKTAGLEGTAILAADLSHQLTGDLTEQELRTARMMIEQISVVEEGALGGNQSVHAMHDATEGGILGACWEMAQASRLGCVVDPTRIPVHQVTRKICRILSLDPLRLISSGSLLIATDRPDELIRAMRERDIACTAIGRLTEDPSCRLQIEDEFVPMMPPDSDELYKVID